MRDSLSDIYDSDAQWEIITKGQLISEATFKVFA